MIMKKQCLTDHISSQTASTYEMIGLIEALGFARQSKIKLFREAFSAEASGHTHKVQQPDVLWISSLQ
jgi:hypothetical protein